MLLGWGKTIYPIGLNICFLTFGHFSLILKGSENGNNLRNLMSTESLSIINNYNRMGGARIGRGASEGGSNGQG